MPKTETRDGFDEAVVLSANWGNLGRISGFDAGRVITPRMFVFVL